MLKVRWFALGVFLAVLVYTGITAAQMGREFMPELEESTLLIRGTFPVNVALPEVVNRTRQFRQTVRKYDELRFVPTAVGRPDDGTDPTGYKQMEAAEKRMARMFALSMVMIVVLLYLAFQNWLDTLTVLANVLGVGIGGVWALKIAGLHFNISAGVGFISILGVAVMNGLIMVSSFNASRAHGMPLEEALRVGVGHRVRPLIMTLLTAILGLLPAALSTKMGSESQKPLAVVVVGGMLFTILVLNLVPVLYSFYGKRTPPAGAGDMVH